MTRVMTVVAASAWAMSAMSCASDSAPTTTSEREAVLGTAVLGAGDAPTIEIVAPQNFTDFAFVEPGTDVSLLVQVDNVTLGPGGHYFRVFVDGELVGSEASSSYLLQDLPKGRRHVAVQLSDGGGTPLTNPEAMATIYVLIKAPCDTDAACDDGLTCSTQTCTLGDQTCNYGGEPNCCDNDLECPSSWFCEDNLCKQCTVADQGEQCHDGNDCTADYCDPVEHACVHAPIDGCCNTVADCDDGLFCTDDFCAAGGCVHTATEDETCCDTAADCAVDDPCIATMCYTSATQNLQFCRVGPPAAGCCTANDDCNDDDQCTLDSCYVAPGAEVGDCVYVPDPEDPLCCVDVGDCDDDDPYTIDACVDHQCQNIHDESVCLLPEADNVVINEIMAAPDKVADHLGEWFEIYNPTSSGIHVHQWTIETSGGESYQINHLGLQVLPGGYLAFGRSSVPAELGFTVHHAYGQAISLPDPAENGGPVTWSLRLRDSDGELVDEVTYDSEEWDMLDGRSMELRNPFVDNNDPDNWRAAGQSETPTKNQVYGPIAFKLYGSPRIFNNSSFQGLLDPTCELPEGSDVCTEGRCNLLGDCQFVQKESCCQVDEDCEDGNPCTVRTCIEDLNLCTSPNQLDYCCLTDSECDDGNPCNVDRCIGSRCRHSPHVVPGCCNVDQDCEDGSVCTINLCDEDSHTCGVPLPGDPECCEADTNCDDGSPATLNVCDMDLNLCDYPPDPEFCTSQADPCDDGNPCTSDSCSTGPQICNHLPIPGCCLSSEQCGDDGQACTQAVCDPVEHQCIHAPISGCCDVADDCDDGNPCTEEFCSGLNNCHHRPIEDCCVTDGECNDGDPCTADLCNAIGVCIHEHQQDCCSPAASQGVLVEQCGAYPHECDRWDCDGVGLEGTCELQIGAGCCDDSDDCADDNECTLDFCAVGNTCKSLPLTTGGCCASSFNCAAGEFCDFATHTCVVQQDLGAVCTGDADCLTGVCFLGECSCPAGFEGPDCTIPVCTPTCPSPYQCTTAGCVHPDPSWNQHVQPVLDAKCSKCHSGALAGTCEGGTCFVDFFEDADTASTICSGQSVAECMLVLLENGTMPKGGGCTGEPSNDAGKPGCLTANELAHLESWLDAGAACGPDGVPCDFGDTCTIDGVCDNGECIGTTPCESGGLCTVDGDLFACQCPPGFGGLRCETNIDECTDETDVGPGTLPNTDLNALADIILVHDPATRDGCVAGFDLILASSPVGNGLGWAVHVYDLVGTSVTLQAAGTVDLDPGHVGSIQTVALSECVPIEAGQFVALMNPEGDTEIALSSEGDGYLFLPGPAKGEIDGPSEDFEQSHGGAALRAFLGHEAPCKNGATCVDEVADYDCTCAPGYGGITCALDLDECDPNPCLNGGACVDAVDGFSCDCPVGFEGTLCEVDFDDCSLSVPLGPQELPNDGASSAHLIVLPQAAPEDGCVSAVTVDLAAVPDDTSGDWEVRVYDVAFGFATLRDTASLDVNTGTMAPQTIGVSPCLPIQEGQHVGVYHDAGPTRISFSAEPGSGYLYLTTPPGDVIGETTTLNAWSGSPGLRGHIEVPVCQNDATCNDDVDSYSCDCLPGYDGTDCETDIDECAPAPCLNGSECVDLVDDYACECAIGFTGETCEIDIDNCDFEPCENGASCSDSVDDYLCTCVDGYTGKNCQTDIDECASQTLIGPEPLASAGIHDAHLVVNQTPVLLDGCVESITLTLGSGPAFAGQDWALHVYEMDGEKATLQSVQPVDIDGTFLGIQTVDLDKCVDVVAGQHLGLTNTHGATELKVKVGDLDGDGYGYWEYMSQAAMVAGQVKTLQAVPYGHSGWRANLVHPTICDNGGICIDEVADTSCVCQPGFQGVLCETNIDECAPAPCLNGAVCHDGVNAYTCTCADGYSGDNCETNIDECAPEPCLNGSLCTDLVFDYACACLPGFEGKDCEINIDECAAEPCENGGGCEDAIADYICHCPPGFVGKACQINVDDCDPNPCNGSDCVDLVNDYACVCGPGMIGEHCAQDADECADQETFGPLTLPQINVSDVDVVVHKRPATDDGCVDEVTFRLSALALEDAQYEVRSYAAFAETLVLKSKQAITINPNLTNEQTVAVEPCLPVAKGHHVGLANATGDVFIAHDYEEAGLGYWTIVDSYAQELDGTGETFVRTVGDVAFTAHVDYGYPCANGAGCVDVLNGFACVCTDGFDGLLCDTNIDECDPNPCLYGTCVDFIDEYACICEDGFEGTNCEIDIDDCALAKCENGATCVDGVDSYTCDCAPGYEGADCSIDTDDCADSPCQNGSACKDQVDAFTCVCLDGFGGELCETNIDECAPEPCQNGGACTDLVADYACTCPPGYHGKDCQGEVDECTVESALGPAALPTDGGLADLLAVSNEQALVSGCIDEITYRLGSAPPGNGTNWEVRTYSVEPYTREATLRSSAPLGQLTTFLNTALTVTVEPCLPITAFDHVALYNPDGALRLQFDSDFGDGYWTLDTEPVGTADGEPDVLSRVSGRVAFEAHVSHTVPCLNGGGCVDQVNAYTCNCAPGYSGVNCEVDEDECAPEPCQNGGICTDGANDYTCACLEGFGGDDCEIDFNECLFNTCLNGGTCFDNPGGFECVCVPGFEGTLCQHNINDCDPDPCQNGGGCIDGVAGFTCDCNSGQTGFEGPTCSDNVDDCVSDPCDNGAVCEDRLLGFYCACPAGYAGPTCSQDVNNCAGNPCMNGGTCSDGVSTYSCECLDGFAGTNCETNVDDCDPNPCLNQGACVDGVDGFTCDCSDGFEGEICSINTDDCEPNPCLNAGICQDLVDSYMCHCADGYTGDECEVDIDECGDDPCLNDGTCVDGVNGYTCDCVDGFTGDDCEVDVNECSTGGCQNGADCQDLVNDYHCDCAPGFVGQDCEVDADECLDDDDIGPASLPTVTPQTADGVISMEPNQLDGCIDTLTVRFGNVAVGGGGGFEVRTYTMMANMATQVASRPVALNGNLFNEQTVTVEPCLPVSQGEFVGLVNTLGDMRLRHTTVGGAGHWKHETAVADLPGIAVPWEAAEGDVAFRVHVQYAAPCLNAGACSDTVDGYLCGCANGYSGTNCETNVDDCVGDPCVNGGTCIDGLASFSCDCAEGFTGTTCVLNIDDCNPDPCENFSECVDGVADYTCECDAGYEGKNCEIDIDECAGDPCLNGGTCLDVQNGFICTCAAGFDGPTCLIDIDECASAPCENGATCVDGINGFTCACAAGYTGTTCGENIDECVKTTTMGPAVLPPTGATKAHLMIHDEAVLVAGCISEVSFRVGSPPDGFGGAWELRAYEIDGDQATLMAAQPFDFDGTNLTEQSVALGTCLPVSAGQYVGIVNLDGRLRLVETLADGDGGWTLETQPGSDIGGAPDQVVPSAGTAGWRAEVVHPDPCPGQTCLDGIDAVTCEPITCCSAPLLIAGVIDGDLPGGYPKGVELYVCETIEDLSEYGLGSANNGGGSDGQEATLPVLSATAGERIYVGSSPDGWYPVFGFTPDLSDGALGVNGNDAIELYRDGTVIDVFGQIDVNGTDTGWEYTNGYAYRDDNTGPNQSEFNAGQWTVEHGALLDLDEAAANALVGSVFGTYTCTP